MESSHGLLRLFGKKGHLNKNRVEVVNEHDCTFSLEQTREKPQRRAQTPDERSFRHHTRAKQEARQANNAVMDHKQAEQQARKERKKKTSSFPTQPPQKSKLDWPTVRQ